MHSIQSGYHAAKIKHLIESQGRRKTWISEQLGVTPSHLSRMIMGERPITDRNAQRLADILGVSVDDLRATEEVSA